MKKILTQALIGAFAVTLFSSCEKNDQDHQPDEANKEFKFVRVLTADGTSTQITQIKPADGTTLTFDAKYPNANLYTTASGR